MNDFQATQDRGWLLVFIAWMVASVSTLGALFLGEVMGYTPCVLCWYQRIGMFPLVLILAAGLFPFDRSVVRYALPLALAGWLLAMFHWAVASGLVPESATPCSQGVPCSVEQISWFGFLTLPLLSVLAFSTIIALLVLTHFKASK
ncbi:MAG: disulfide bond formation protein B [Thiobacillus sp.]|nr:disulfide bond formation protein B [Thiobacillus sp.]MDP2253621.1 disulfide bond formation protein B [Thiobacillus sp.]MDP2979523.1 disulfide bond formation protein B [Thiobacillus sp.]